MRVIKALVPEQSLERGPLPPKNPPLSDPATPYLNTQNTRLFQSLLRSETQVWLRLDSKVVEGREQRRI